MKRIAPFVIVLLTSFATFSQISQVPSGPVYTGQQYTFTAPCLNCLLPNWEVDPDQQFLTSNNGFSMIIIFNSTGPKTLTFKNGTTTVYQTFVNVVSSGGGSGSTSEWTEDTNGIHYDGGNVGIGANSHATYRLDVSGTTRVVGDVIANRFTDNNNSAYYVDPGSTSKLNEADANNYDVNPGDGRGIRFWNSNSYKIHMGDVAENKYGPVTDYSIKMNMNNSAARGWTWGVSGATPVAAINTEGKMQIKNDFTTEGDGINIRGASPTIHFNDINSTDEASIHVNGNWLYFLTHHNTNGDSHGGGWDVNGSYWPLRINLTNDDVEIGGNTYLMEGNLYGKSVNAAYSNLYKFGGIYFTWDSDSYGTNTHHSIRSTYGNSYGDHLTMNSFGHIRFNFDSNNNGNNVFQIGHQTTGTGNVLFHLNESGQLGLGTSTPTSGYRLDVIGSINATGGNSNNWNTAFTERGSQIAGTGLTWSGGKLNAAAHDPATIITNTSQWNPDGDGAVLVYDDSNPTYNGKYTGAVIDIRGDNTQDNALVRTGAYHADHFQASRGYYIGNPETNGTRIIDSSGNINTAGSVQGSNLAIANWNAAYAERGSQIAGNGLLWTGGKLNVTEVGTDNQTLTYDNAQKRITISGGNFINVGQLDTRLTNAEVIAITDGEGYLKNGASPTFGTVTATEMRAGGTLRLGNNTSGYGFALYDGTQPVIEYGAEKITMFGDDGRLTLETIGSNSILVQGQVRTVNDGNSSEWNAAYAERGSQIAGNGLTWNGTQLDVENVNTDNQDLSIAGNILSLTNDATTVDLSGYLDNTDAQALTLAGTDLTISGGNTIDISSIDTDTQLSDADIAAMGYIKTETDNQDLALAGNILSLTNDATTVDLSGYLDNTDAQALTLAGTDLTISGGNTIDISSIDTDTQLSDADISALGYIKTQTDNQDLTIAGNILSLTNDATTVDLSGYLDNTDAQALTLAGTDLTISGGNTVDISSIDTDTQLSDADIAAMGYIKTSTDDQTASEVAFTSTTGLIATEVAGALDEINTKVDNNVSSFWTENAGNIAFTTGQVSIGTTETKPGYELSVGGEIVAEEILIEYESEWPDYVFDDTYNLLSIMDLKKFIEENKHLPNVPSEAEVKENGIEIGEMNKILLEKIEELTLYMIKQSEEIETLKEKVEELQNNK